MQVDNAFGPVDIAISGLRAQQKQIEVISSNVTNARTTDAGKGEPYRRREALFKTEDDEITGVSLDKISTDRSDFCKLFDPGHPNADEDGYVAMPNVNLPTEMINLTIATRAYQANAAILKRYQQMVETTLELLK
ncbi:MAG: flagellar basal body rod protein FlgC [Planctomycetota bacterium]|jgi:flagellar basal-body rod protein FlgC